MTTALKVLAKAIALVLIIDLFGFLLWIASGQMPPDGFYVGIVTSTVLNLFI